MFFGARRYMTGGNLFRTLLEIEVSRIQPRAAKGRPRQLHFDEAFDCILRVVRTGMQWRQLQPPTVSHITIFKTMHTWMRHRAFETAYCRLLRLYRRHRRPRFCCIDSSYVKNIYGLDCTGRNPTDRRRRATKLSTRCSRKRFRPASL